VGGTRGKSLGESEGSAHQQHTGTSPKAQKDKRSARKNLILNVASFCEAGARIQAFLPDAGRFLAETSLQKKMKKLNRLPISFRS
jgi:hypothetical protein